jgi:hypothetical protein
MLSSMLLGQRMPLEIDQAATRPALGAQALQTPGQEAAVLAGSGEQQAVQHHHQQLPEPTAAP